MSGEETYEEMLARHARQRQALYEEGYDKLAAIHRKNALAVERLRHEWDLEEARTSKRAIGFAVALFVASMTLVLATQWGLVAVGFVQCPVFLIGFFVGKSSSARQRIREFEMEHGELPGASKGTP